MINRELLNTEALKAAINLLYGPQGYDMLSKAYVAFDAAITASYKAGTSDGFNEGYDAAEDDALEAAGTIAAFEVILDDPMFADVHAINGEVAADEDDELEDDTYNVDDFTA